MVQITQMDDIDDDEEEEQVEALSEVELAQVKEKAHKLLEAVREKDLRAAHHALEEGADVEFVFGDEDGSGEGFTALMVACYRGDAQVDKTSIYT